MKKIISKISIATISLFIILSFAFSLVSCSKKVSANDMKFIQEKEGMSIINMNEVGKKIGKPIKVVKSKKIKSKKIGIIFEELGGEKAKGAKTLEAVLYIYNSDKANKVHTILTVKTDKAEFIEDVSVDINKKELDDKASIQSKLDEIVEVYFNYM